jgi:GT2 family glycosyltransferase
VDIAAVVREFEPACKYLRQENQGPAAARNHGFSHSQGRYVAFVDSDDEWFPDAAQKIIRLFESNLEVDMIFAEARMGNSEEGYRSWIEVAGEDEFFQLPCRVEAEGLRIFQKTPLFRRMLVRNAVFISAVIMRREAFEKAGTFTINGLFGTEDWELWLRMAHRMQLAFYPEPLAIYRRHVGCMSNNHDSMGEAFYSALMKVRDKCPDLDLEDLNILDRQLQHHLFNQAYSAYDQGDLRLARKRFARLHKEAGLKMRDALLWSLCFLPPQAVRILRQCKWALGV